MLTDGSLSALVGIHELLHPAATDGPSEFFNLSTSRFGSFEQRGTCLFCGPKVRADLLNRLAFFVQFESFCLFC